MKMLSTSLFSKKRALRLLLLWLLNGLFFVKASAQCDCDGNATLAINPPDGYGCPTVVHIYSNTASSATASWTTFWGNPAEQPLTFVNGVATFEMGQPLTFSIWVQCTPTEGCWILQNYTPNWPVFTPSASFSSICGIPNSTVQITDTDDNCMDITVYAIRNESPNHSFEVIVPPGGSFTVNNVPPGTYTAYLSSYVYFGNYTTSAIQTFTVNGAPTATFQKTKPACFGDSDGMLKCNPQPLLGASSYNYIWNTGATTRQINNIPAGVYSVTMTQIATGCTGTASYELTEPTPVTMSLSTVHNKCYGQELGKVVALASGGTGLKTYNWSTGSTANKIQNLPAGDYSVTATDTKGCTAEAMTTINTPSEVLLGHSVETLPNGKFKVTLSASGGTPYATAVPYRYCKMNASGLCGYSSTFEYSNLLPGTYTFKARDKNACETSIEVAVPPSLMMNDELRMINLGAAVRENASFNIHNSSFIITPNPFENQLVVAVSDLSIFQKLTNPGQFRVRVFDAVGRLTASQNFAAGSESIRLETQNFLPGVYQIQVLDSEGRVLQVLRAVK